MHTKVSVRLTEILFIFKSGDHTSDHDVSVVINSKI
jgi:hypothetical protein